MIRSQFDDGIKCKVTYMREKVDLEAATVNWLKVFLRLKSPLICQQLTGKRASASKPVNPAYSQLESAPAPSTMTSLSHLLITSVCNVQSLNGKTKPNK